ncbi:MAG: L,D-transpeptidase family protein [Bdellovibrionia bacterium]
MTWNKIVSTLLIQSLVLSVVSTGMAQSRKAVCLEVEPVCTRQNLANFPNFKLPNQNFITIYSEPLRLLYSQRDYRNIWHANNRLDIDKMYALIAFFEELTTAKIVDFSRQSAYLRTFLFTTKPIVTTEYLASALLIEALDKVENRRGRFFENFKDLASVVDQPAAHLKSSLINAYIKAKAEPKKEVVKPEKPVSNPATPETPKAPVVQPTPPSQSVVVAPVTPAPTTPAAPAREEVRPVENVSVIPGTGSIVVPIKEIGISRARYETDPTEMQSENFVSTLGQNLFVQESGVATSLVQEVRKILRDAEVHGLNPDDYWDRYTENNYNNGRVLNRLDFHQQVGRGILRYVTHLNIGRVQPQKIDSFKFATRSFGDFFSLTIALNGALTNLGALLESYAPSHPQYKDLKLMLNNLRYIQAQGSSIATLNRDLSLYQMGKRNSHILNMRTRLAQLGYQVKTGSDVYDVELDEVLRKFASQNSLASKLGDAHIQKLNVSIADRIKQVIVNMEKLRFLPVGPESRYIFVNLAFSEVKLYDAGSIKMNFRTVNGRMNGPQDDKKTPSMTQVMRHVLLNPTWTVPAGMAVTSKVPLIQRDENYADKNNFKVAQGFVEKRVWDPVLERYMIKRVPDYISWSSVDWSGFRPNPSTRYWIVQQPGFASTLGVLKFPLYDYQNQNRINEDDIYLHDTNERHLFANAKRLDSSGCIRLQYPVEFAAELVQGNLGYDLDKIKSYLPTHAEDEIAEDYTNMQINLRRPITVHLLYLTAEKGEQNEMRFVEDQHAYQLDGKILAAIEGSR